MLFSFREKETSYLPGRGRSWIWPFVISNSEHSGRRGRGAEWCDRVHPGETIEIRAILLGCVHRHVSIINPRSERQYQSEILLRHRRGSVCRRQPKATGNASREGGVNGTTVAERPSNQAQKPQPVRQSLAAPHYWNTGPLHRNAGPDETDDLFALFLDTCGPRS